MKDNGYKRKFSSGTGNLTVLVLTILNILIWFKSFFSIEVELCIFVSYGQSLTVSISE